MEIVTNCRMAMRGHTKKTKLAGVIKVGNAAAKAALVVGPTVLVKTLDNVASVAAMGPMLIMDAMLTRPK
jgi:hypothetical protein